MCSKVKEFDEGKLAKTSRAKAGGNKSRPVAKLSGQLATKKARKDASGEITEQIPRTKEQLLKYMQQQGNQHAMDEEEESDEDHAVFGDDTDESDDERSADGGDIQFRINKESLATFKNYVAKASEECEEFDKEEEAGIALMNILRNKKASLDTYDSVMQWHLEVNAKKMADNDNAVPPSKHYLSRKVLINRLAERYGMDPTNLVPSKHVILPSSSSRVKIVHHRAKEKVVSLLTDPRVKDEDYLFFDDDPFAPPPEDLDYIADVNTGTSYRITWLRLITKPGKQILVPIIMYIDGMVSGQFDKCQVEQLKFTLGIFNRKARDNEYLWRTLGYIPNFTKESSRGKKMFKETRHVAAQNLYVSDGEGEDAVHVEKEYKTQDYHSIMTAILESYRELESEVMVWDLKYRGKVYKDVELVFYLAFMKVDNDEADKLCGQFRSRSKIKCLCRYCTCPTAETDNQFAKFPYKEWRKIKRLSDNDDIEALKKISQQCIDNAFHGIRFGMHNARGIHCACPLELLHSLLLGSFQRTRDGFFEQIGKKSALAEEINALAMIYGKLLSHQADRDLPKTTFNKGIMKGKIQAKEFSGVLLIIALVLQSHKGRTLLSTRRRSKFGGGKLDDWVMLVETLLEWEAFLKLDRMEMKHVKRLPKKHQYIMFLMKKVSKRTKGMGMKMIKFHGISHMAEDIKMFGVPMVSDTGSNETHHKVYKGCAQNTQKNMATFNEQTEQRHAEFELLDLALAELEGNPLWAYWDIDDEVADEMWEVGKNDDQFGETDDQFGATDDIEDENDTQSSSDDDHSQTEDSLESLPIVNTRGTKITVFRDAEGVPRYDFPGSRMKDPHRASWEDSITDYMCFVQDAVSPHLTEGLCFRTEHKRGKEIFRGHPHFRQNGMWNDWVIVDWGRNSGGETPCEIWCFADLRGLPEDVHIRIDDVTVQKGVYAIVESATVAEEHGANSVLFQPIFKEGLRMDDDDDGKLKGRNFYLADVDAFVAPAVVVPDIGSPQLNKYFLLKPRDQWARGFTRWVEDEYYLDDMQEVEEEPVEEEPPAQDESGTDDDEDESEDDEEESEDDEEESDDEE